MNKLTAWLIYNRFESRRNSFLADKILNVLRERGVSCRLLIWEDITFGEGFYYRNERLEYPDFVILRTVDLNLTRHLQQYCAVFNNDKVSEIANDKYKTYQLAKSLSIPVMETELNPKSITDFPKVVKPISGHGGMGVELVYNSEQFNCAVEAIGGDYICQELCSKQGSDTRVYVLFGEPIVAIERYTDGAFLANFCRGASARVTDIAPQMVDIIKKLHSRLDFGYVGVDFLRHGDGYVLGEIEDVVGARMVYSITDIDIISLFIDKIIQRLH